MLLPSYTHNPSSESFRKELRVYTMAPNWKRHPLPDQEQFYRLDFSLPTSKACHEYIMAVHEQSSSSTLKRCPGLFQPVTRVGGWEEPPGCSEREHGSQTCCRILLALPGLEPPGHSYALSSSFSFLDFSKWVWCSLPTLAPSGLGRLPLNHKGHSKILVFLS